ncbi:MAG: hypothetical protein Fur006_37580 [Coleofasciculaceae cyanobacterium]
MTQLSEGFDFTRDGVDPSQWPKLSCSQPNQLALEVSDLRLDANREILFQGNGQLTTSGDMLLLTGGSSSEKLTVLANGNVGIGRTNPSYKLAIAAGDINIDDGCALRQAGRWVIGGDSNVLGIGSSNKSDGRDIRFDPGFAGGLTIKQDTGNVGIGTTNPVSKLSIFSTQPDQSEGMIHLEVTEPFSGGHRPLTIAKRNSANTARLDWTFEVSEGDSPGFSIWRVLRANNASPSFVRPLHLTWDGNVGIGTIPKQIFAGSDSSRVATPLTIKATGVSQGLITFEDASGTPTWHINQKLGGTISGLNFAETKVADGRLFIASGGNVGIGTTNPAYKLDVAGAAHASSFPTSSDVRLKKDITQLTNVLEKLEKIRGVVFEWNELYESLGRSTGHKEIGVMAQEVEAVFPELVTTWGDECYKAVDYGRLTGVLIEAAKELKAENVALKQRIEALETAIEKTQKNKN